MEADLSLAEKADIAPDTSKKSKKPVITDRLSEYIKTLTSFLGEGLHKTILVREERLELSRPKAYAPKAYVYTNFTTRAYLLMNLLILTIFFIFRNT